MRVLLVSDLHANPDALAVLPNADATICAGDLVDYGPDPVAAIRWCRERQATVVTGNHDFAISHNADCGVKGRMREASVRTRAVHLKLIGARDLDYLRKLPNFAVDSIEGVRFAVTHAAPNDVYPYLTLAVAGGLLREAAPSADVFVLGHTHVQGVIAENGKTIVNPGSAGMASVGGTVHYALWEDGVTSLHAAQYDVEAAIAKLRLLDLEVHTIDLVANALRSGRARDPGDFSTR